MPAASPRRNVDPLRTTSATTCVPAAPDVVWAAVLDLTSRLWSPATVVAQPPGLLVQAVGDEVCDEPDGWLTWSIADVSATGSRVTVSFAEFADATPDPELDVLLCRLVAHAVAGADRF
jgi:hypothetical protein